MKGLGMFLWGLVFGLILGGPVVLVAQDAFFDGVRAFRGLPAAPRVERDGYGRSAMDRQNEILERQNIILGSRIPC